MKLKPLADRVIVRQSEAEDQDLPAGFCCRTPCEGKAYQGQGDFRRPRQAGRQRQARMEVAVRVGDSIYCPGKYSGTDVEIDGEKFVILRESDILGVLE